MDARKQASTHPGRVVVVTGAASGMGEAEARLFAARGDRVAVVDLDAARAEATAASLAATGGVALAVAADLTSRDDIARVVETTERELGPIDVLVNNAGIFDGYAASLDTGRDLWDRIIAVDLTSVYEMSNAVLPGMLDRGRGVIVNIASLAAIVGGKGGAAYTVAKHGVLGYTKHLAAEYARRGIRCNAVSPGTIETALTASTCSRFPSIRFPPAVSAPPTTSPPSWRSSRRPKRRSCTAST